jgi:hypothetical protein
MPSRYVTITGDTALSTAFHKYIKYPIDSIVEATEVALGMYPNNLHITTCLLPNIDAVSRLYFDRYREVKRYKSFISLSQLVIYVSVKDVTPTILVHEIAHAIVAQYFTERPPYAIHELLAQYAEKHAMAILKG